MISSTTSCRNSGDLRVFLVSNLSSLIYCLIYAYYGHALGSIALSRSGMAGITESSGGLFPLLLGIVATVLATVLVARTSIRVLKDVLGKKSEAFAQSMNHSLDTRCLLPNTGRGRGTRCTTSHLRC